MRYPPSGGKLDYFDLFDLPRSYNVDVKILANKFKALQRLFHPDLFANRTDKEKSLSETW
jgi:molecular chaperone HscB